MKRNELFTNYLTDHFEHKTDFSSDALALEFNAFQRNILPHLPSDKTINVLEIGFGTGILIKYLKEVQGFTNIIGVDYSQELTDFVKKNLHEGVYCIPDLIEWLKEKENQFDLIFMFDVLEHIPKTETINSLKQIQTSLKEKGVFIARVPNGSNPFNIQMAYDDFTHEFLFTKNSLSQVLSLSGFKHFSIHPYLEENHSTAGKIHDKTRSMVFFILKSIIKLSRAFTQPDSIYTRNIMCVAHKT